MIATRWKEPGNAELARETQYVVRLLYVSEDLERRVGELSRRRQQLSESLEKADIQKVVDIAVEDTEMLVDTAARLETLSRIKNDLESRMAAGQPPEEIFNISSRDVYIKLAEAASNLRGRTTSWTAVARANSVLIALGDAAKLFLDVESI